MFCECFGHENKLNLKNKFNTHNHCENDSQIISRKICGNKQLKCSAENDLHIKPNKLIRHELPNTENSENVQYNDLKQLHLFVFMYL